MRPLQTSLIILIFHLYARYVGALPPISSIASAPLANAFNPFNLTVPVHISALPANPAYYWIPRSAQALKLSHYGRHLPKEDVLSCLLQASNMAIEHLAAGIVELVGENTIQTDWGVAHLFFYPSEKMTWAMFGTAIRGLTDFVTEWEYVEIDFEVGETGVRGNIASGVLFYT